MTVDHSTGEVRVMLRCSIQNVIRLCDTGQLDHYKIGRNRRITMESLRKYAKAKGIPLAGVPAEDPTEALENLREVARIARQAITVMSDQLQITRDLEEALDRCGEL